MTEFESPDAANEKTGSVGALPDLASKGIVSDDAVNINFEGVKTQENIGDFSKICLTNSMLAGFASGYKGVAFVEGALALAAPTEWIIELQPWAANDDILVPVLPTRPLAEVIAFESPSVRAVDAAPVAERADAPATVDASPVPGAAADAKYGSWIVPRIPPLESLPPRLQKIMRREDAPACISWRMAHDAERDEWKKIPVSAVGNGAKWGKPEDRGTYDLVARRYGAPGSKFGLGIALGVTSRDGAYGLSGLDVDSCRDPETGEIADWAKPAIALLSTYGEISPSGTGIKFFFLLKTADIPKIDALLDDIRRNNKGPAHVFDMKGSERVGDAHLPQFELFIKEGRWFTVTGERFMGFSDAAAGNVDLSEADVEPVSVDAVTSFIRDIAVPFSGRVVGNVSRLTQQNMPAQPVAAVAAAGGTRRGRPPKLTLVSNNGVAAPAQNAGPAAGVPFHMTDLTDAFVAECLDGDVVAPGIIRCTPIDREDAVLMVFRDPKAPDGFRTYTFVGGVTNRPVDRDLVYDRVDLIRGLPPRKLTAAEKKRRSDDDALAAVEYAARVKRRAEACAAVWDNAAPLGADGTAYFAWRGGLVAPEGIFRETNQHVNGNGDIYEGCPQIIARVWALKPDVRLSAPETFIPNGLLCIEIERDGDVVRNVRVDGKSRRRTPGVVGPGFILLAQGGEGTKTVSRPDISPDGQPTTVEEATPCRAVLVGEGVDTVLSAAKLKLPVTNYAVVSFLDAGTLSEAPILSEFDTYILAEDDDPKPPDGGLGTGAQAVSDYVKRLVLAGLDAFVIHPQKPVGERYYDANDIVVRALREKRETMIGLDYEVEYVAPGSDAAKDILRRQAVDGWPADQPGWPVANAKTGEPLDKSLRNALVAIKRRGWKLAHNTFRDVDLFTGYLNGQYHKDVRLSNAMLKIARVELANTYSFDPGGVELADALLGLSACNAHHPVRDYRRSLPVWDGVRRLDSWLTDYLGVENSELARVCGLIWMIAAARRIMQPGVKFDFCLTLQGPQGAGKSSVFQILFGQWHSDTEVLHKKDREVIETLSGVWGQELAELAGMSKIDDNQLKQFLSRTEDKARGAYARIVDTVPRQCVFGATVNEERFLRDPTGARRWWIFPVGKILLEKLKADRDMLWSEAFAREAAGESILLPEHLWQAAGDVQELHRIKDSVERKLHRIHREVDEDGRQLAVLAGMKKEFWRICFKDVHHKVLGLLKGAKISPAENDRIDTTLAKKGWFGPDELAMGGTKYAYEKHVAAVLAEDIEDGLKGLEEHVDGECLSADTPADRKARLGELRAKMVELRSAGIKAGEAGYRAGQCCAAHRKQRYKAQDTTDGAPEGAAERREALVADMAAALDDARAAHKAAQVLIAEVRTLATRLGFEFSEAGVLVLGKGPPF